MLLPERLARWSLECSDTRKLDRIPTGEIWSVFLCDEPFT
ncbi:hypothetical protein D923_02025 [Enterococcus faecalis 06-MB-S-04]|nr:hypothetical protein D923_02025 [Enterococcus faecalis 06-MB-S-04]